MTVPERGNATFVGFGFGPIQGGLFLYEAFRSGAFGRLVVAEVVPEVVRAVREAGSWYSVNVAHFDGIENARVGPVEMLDPGEENDRARLVDAVAEAQEIATAVPSVQHYVSASHGSLHRTLAAGLLAKAERNGPSAVVYAAENHNHAAEILEEAALREVPQGKREAVASRVRFLNTVIGKMSGVISGPEEIAAAGLAPITPGQPRAFLVEAFNRILVSRASFDFPFTRGIAVFEEKDDLLPFEEAKLYGHNATHALLAYTCALGGMRRIADASGHPGVLEFARAAFIGESGEALTRKHSGVDRLFTPAGYADYADDLLRRMVNPYLLDTVERVGRDPERKLGWDDRLIGTIRVAHSAGVAARRYAFGVAAGMAVLDRSILGAGQPLEPMLDRIWNFAAPDQAEKAHVIRLIEDGRACLRRWLDLGCPPPERLYAEAGSVS